MQPVSTDILLHTGMPRAGLEKAQHNVHPDGKHATRILGDSGTDFRCFFQYQDALARKANSEQDVGICIMSLEKCSTMFGEKMILRTCVNLAINGKPSELLVKVIGGKIVEGSGVLDPRPETRGHA